MKQLQMILMQKREQLMPFKNTEQNFQSKAKFYKDATAKKARADANKTVQPKQRG